jgi:hypothetical protein
MIERKYWAARRAIARASTKHPDRYTAARLLLVGCPDILFEFARLPNIDQRCIDLAASVTEYPDELERLSNHMIEHCRMIEALDAADVS